MKVPTPRKLKSGNYFIQLRLGGESIPITDPDKEECTRQARYVKAEYLAGKRQKKEEPTPKLPTLGEAVDAYIAARSNVLSPSTIRGYKTIRRNRFKDLMDTSLSDIADSEWIKACNQEAALCSAKTLTNSWRFIATVIRDAARREPPPISLPQIVPNERQFLEPDQIKLFVQAAKGNKYEIPALLALSSLRRSEICGLQWENIDLKKRRILVKGAVVPDESHKFVRKLENKNRTSTRYVPIMMDELYDALDREKKASGPVLICNPNTLRSGINRICASAGVPQVGVHGLRHSFASLAYHLGVPEKIAMEIGGWADSQTMRKIYTHVAKSDMTRYETQLSDFFNNANKNANKN